MLFKFKFQKMYFTLSDDILHEISVLTFSTQLYIYRPISNLFSSNYADPQGVIVDLWYSSPSFSTSLVGSFCWRIGLLIRTFDKVLMVAQRSFDECSRSWVLQTLGWRNCLGFVLCRRKSSQCLSQLDGENQLVELGGPVWSRYGPHLGSD